MYLGVVEKFNAIVNPNNRVMIIDVSDEQQFGVNFNNMSNMVEWSGTPTLYLNGIMLEGATSPKYIEGFLKSYFEGIGERI